MLRDFIVFYAKPIVFGLVIVFIIVKLLMLSLFGIKGDRPRIFMISLSILGRGVIENTFYDHLQDYYRASNRVNKLFYLLIILFGVLYYVVKFYIRR